MIKEIADEMEVYVYKPNVANGSIVWLRNGLKIKTTLLREINKILPGYRVETPSLCNERLWRKSGHMDHFQQNMYLLDKSAFKPMNCPFHIVLASDLYRKGHKLPIVISEQSLVYRKEYSGGLLPPLRSNTFTQDDSHVFTNLEDSPEQFKKFINLTKNFYLRCNFNRVKTILALSNESESVPEVMEANVFLKKHLEPIVDEVMLNEGAFYGPKIEFHLTDHNDKDWQCGTIQLDLSAGTKFKLPGQPRDRKVLIHRAMLGSVERFVGILLSHSKGYLPGWIHPSPYAVMIFKEKNKEIFTGYKNKIVGLKNIRRAYKEHLLKRTRVIVFYGDEEEKEGKMKLQIYLPDRVLQVKTPVDLFRKLNIIDLIDRADSVFYCRCF